MEKSKNIEEEVADSDDEGEEEVDTSQASQELLKTETEIEIETDGEIKTQLKIATAGEIKTQLKIAIETDRKIEKLGDRFEELEDFGYRRFYVKDYPYLYIAAIIGKKQYYLSMKVFKYVKDIQLPQYLLRKSPFDFSAFEKLPFRDETTQLMTDLNNDEIYGVISEMKAKFNTVKWKQLKEEYGLDHRYETPMMYHKKRLQKMLLILSDKSQQEMYEIVCAKIAEEWKEDRSVVKSVLLFTYEDTPGFFYEYDSTLYRFLMRDITSKYSIYYQCKKQVYLSPPDTVPTTILMSGTAPKREEFLNKVVCKAPNNEVSGTFSQLPKGKRTCGQDSVMGGISAKKFAIGLKQDVWSKENRETTLKYKDERFWEWLHLYAFSYGKCNYALAEKQSPQDARNLVLGTANANTAMLVVESFLKKLLAAGVTVTVTAATSGLKISDPEKDVYCSCVVKRISYKAQVYFSHNPSNQIVFQSEFDPFDACPVPSIAISFRKALASWYIETIQKSAEATSRKMLEEELQ